MQFLNPVFLLGSLAVAVPIVLHLMRRQYADRISFPSLMFLRKVPKREVDRQRLKYLFLLLLRCLGILLLVAAFARPVVTRKGVGLIHPLPARSVIILIDGSLSMSSQDSWEKMLQAADERIQSLGSGDEALIMQFAETAQVLSGWQKGKGTLLEILEKRVVPGFQATSYVEGLRGAVEQFQGARRARKEIFLITDLQRRGLDDSSGWKVPADIEVQVERVGSEASNLFVEEVTLEKDLYSEQYPYPISVRLRNTPNQIMRGEAQLILEGKQVDKRRFETTDTGSATVTFAPFELEEGVSRGKIVIEPTDSLASDNTFFFVVERQKRQKITVYSGPGKSSAFYLQQVFSTGQNRPFQVQSVTAPGSRRDLEDAAVVVLDDLAVPPPLSIFDGYVKNGGGLIIALGSSVQADAYNQKWGSFLPVELADRYFSRGQKKPFTSITEVSWEHPVFTVFRNLQQRAIANAQFFGYWKVKPKADGVVLARFSGGDPALVKKFWGKGRMLVFSSSLDTVWGDLPLRKAYVPFWYRMVEYAAAWQASWAAMRVGQILPVEATTAEFLTGKDHGSPKGNIIDPRGQRILRLDGERPSFVPLRLPGYYEIRSHKKTDWIAVNCDPSESDLRTVSRKEFMATFVSAKALSSAVTNVRKLALENQIQQPLWWLFLISATLILGTESVVANRFYGRTRG